MGRKRNTPPPDDLGWSDIVSAPIAVPDHLDLKTARGVEAITVKRLGHAEWKLCQARAFTQIYEHYGSFANDVMEMGRRARESRDNERKLLTAGEAAALKKEEEAAEKDPHKDVEAAFQANHPDWLCALGVTRFDGRTLTRDRCGWTASRPASRRSPCCGALNRCCGSRASICRRPRNRKKTSPSLPRAAGRLRRATSRSPGSCIATAAITTARRALRSMSWATPRPNSRSRSLPACGSCVCTRRCSRRTNA